MRLQSLIAKLRLSTQERRASSGSAGTPPAAAKYTYDALADALVVMVARSVRSAHIRPMHAPALGASVRAMCVALRWCERVCLRARVCVRAPVRACVCV